MDTQDILKTLNNLEQSLQNVESARQQVANTVNAYEGAKTQLHALAMEFAIVSNELKNIYTAINENVSSIDNTLQDKIETVFSDITCKTQGLEDAVRNIQTAFVTTCNQSAQSIKSAVDNSLLKLNNEVDTTIVNFSKKATHELESVATELSAFKSSAQQMQKDFHNAITGATADFKASQKSIATDFETSIKEHLSSFKSLKMELKSIIDKYEDYTNSLATKIELVSDLVKTERTSIISEMQNLQESQKTKYDDLISKLKSLRDENFKVADNLSERFNNVDKKLDNLLSSNNVLKENLDNTSLLIIKIQKEAMDRTEKKFADEIDSLKKEFINSKKLTMYCFIVLVISLILNLIAFVR